MRLKVEQQIASLERAEPLLGAAEDQERALLEALESTIDNNRSRCGHAFCKHRASLQVLLCSLVIQMRASPAPVGAAL